MWFEHGCCIAVAFRVVDAYAQKETMQRIGVLALAYIGHGLICLAAAYEKQMLRMRVMVVEVSRSASDG